ncbi:MAG: HlyD family secretion protein [Marinilabiliales bacterium]|nr:MAG: HlyD family secretion protein [Marinilabiliales bacterium]
MKYFIGIISLLVLITSCNNNDDLSDAYGNFEATEIIISSQANGELLTFNLEEGDLLSENQIIGLVDTVDLHLRKKLLIQQIQTIKSQLVSINSEIDVQKQQLDNNLIQQKRVENLYSQGAATKKQMDDINGMVDVNRKVIISINSKKQSILDQIKGVEIQIEQIEESISKCIIKNPVNGTVLVKYAEKGELANMGKPLYKVADVENIKLKAYVSGSQLPDVILGDEVEVLYDKNMNSNTSTKGKVIWISNTAEFTPKTIQTKDERVNLVYAVKVLVKNDGSIKIGMPGEMNFVK